MLRAGPVVQGFAYVAIGLAASSFLTFPVAVQLLKPRKPQSLAPIAAPKDIESSLDIQVGAQIDACLKCTDMSSTLLRCTLPSPLRWVRSTFDWRHSAKSTG